MTGIRLKKSPEVGAPVRADDLLDEQDQPAVLSFLQHVAEISKHNPPMSKSGKSSYLGMTNRVTDDKWLCEIDGYVISSYGRNNGSRQSMARSCLKSSPPIRDPADPSVLWRICVGIDTELPTDRVPKHIKDNPAETACCFIWDRADGDTRAHTLAEPKSTMQPLEIKKLGDLQGIIRLNLRGVHIDKRITDQVINAAARARLLSFDAKLDSKYDKNDQLESTFAKDEDMDRALVALVLRMEEYPYSFRWLMNGGETKGYVSAGPMSHARSELTSDFSAHGNNFTHSDIVWDDPGTSEPITLCYSGFRLHPDYQGNHGANMKLVEAAWDICADYISQGWTVNRIMINKQQPTGLSVLNTLLTDRLNENDEFVCLRPDALKAAIQTAAQA